MVYDHNGVIICIEKDVSAINPEGASVVELPDITANRRADISGKWLFKDGVVIKRTYTEEEQRQQAENEKQSLLQLVRDKTQLWDSQLRLGIISNENKQKLTEWMLYAAEGRIHRHLQPASNVSRTTRMKQGPLSGLNFYSGFCGHSGFAVSTRLTRTL
ncbi:tail fiber assembly protein (gpg) [Escherichia coli]|uniref:Tail fiber assembly protein (Gpg) n=1 Tax=Escherichia coli TaxID=562 RepID=A0AAX2KKV2_ECOLX|nr:tail fiber assembly protein (gpg) [Escherichia coli]